MFFSMSAISCEPFAATQDKKTCSNTMGIKSIRGCLLITICVPSPDCDCDSDYDYDYDCDSDGDPYSAGPAITTHWSPIQRKGECWQPEFQNWLPTGDFN